MVLHLTPRTNISLWMEWIRSTDCTLRPASLLWRFIAARESCPVSNASTNCLEMASPKPTLSLQPPQSQPWPPSKNNSVRMIRAFLFKLIFVCTHKWTFLTSLSVPAVVAATVVKVSEAAVPGQSVHDSGRADGMDKRCLPICCEQRKLIYWHVSLQRTLRNFISPSPSLSKSF